MELDSKQKKKYRKLFKPQDIVIETDMEGNVTIRSIERNGIYLPLISIGQMIEFLNEKSKLNWDIRMHGKYVDLNYPIFKHGPDDYEDYKELCNALWEVVKSVL